MTWLKSKKKRVKNLLFHLSKILMGFLLSINVLSSETIDNHGRAIATALPLCVAFKLSSLPEYFDSRFFETE
jgi:hypothetical protein